MRPGEREAPRRRDGLGDQKGDGKYDTIALAWLQLWKLRRECEAIGGFHVSEIALMP